MTYIFGQKRTEPKVNHTDHPNDEPFGQLLIDPGASRTLITSAHHIHSTSPDTEINTIDA